MDYRKQKIEYVRYYSAGSEAYQLEPKEPVRNRPVRKKASRPVPQPQKVVEICVDPLALIAICLTIVMAVLMVVGFNRLQQAQAELQQMETYISWLNTEVQKQTERLESGYDLEAIRKAATSLGMVPIEQVDHLSVAMDAAAD